MNVRKAHYGTDLEFSADIYQFTVSFLALIVDDCHVLQSSGIPALDKYLYQQHVDKTDLPPTIQNALFTLIGGSFTKDTPWTLQRFECFLKEIMSDKGRTEYTNYDKIPKMLAFSLNCIKEQSELSIRSSLRDMDTTDTVGDSPKQFL
eukprot:TRINITY_DN1616_c0_g1_i1.p1 TRINITY_DN1616_c0_g1~~TRINITY_DN1616_c0_g1_i1.p1  ORF type:complete len:148 (+),score=18.50 TRINITY_DN1616_c0_g1_i1:255-698(+)